MADSLVECIHLFNLGEDTAEAEVAALSKSLHQLVGVVPDLVSAGLERRAYVDVTDNLRAREATHAAFLLFANPHGLTEFETNPGYQTLREEVYRLMHQGDFRLFNHYLAPNTESAVERITLFDLVDGIDSTRAATDLRNWLVPLKDGIPTLLYARLEPGVDVEMPPEVKAREAANALFFGFKHGKAVNTFGPDPAHITFRDLYGKIRRPDFKLFHHYTGPHIRR